MSTYEPDPMPTTPPTVGDRSLPTTFQYPPRKVAPGSIALIGQPGYDPNEFTTLGRARGPGGNTGGAVYLGPKLVDRNGVIARDPYSVKEAYGILASQPRAERIAFTTELYERGAYNGGRPSATRLGSADVNAMENYLLTMNRYGVTFDVGLPFFRDEFPVGGAMLGGAGRGRRVTSSADLGVVFKKTYSDMIGQDPTPEQEARFAKLYQQMEMSDGTERVAAPSTVAMNEIENRYGTQVGAFRAGNAASIMDRMIKRLGD